MTSHESDFANERCDAETEDFQGGRFVQGRGGGPSGAQAAGVTSSGGGALPVKISDFWILRGGVAFLRLAGDPSQFFFRRQRQRSASAGRWRSRDDRRTVVWVYYPIFYWKYATRAVGSEVLGGARLVMKRACTQGRL